MSSVQELRQAAKECIDVLPREQLVAATEFLRFLRERGSDAATAELLRIPGLLESLNRAEQDRQRGRGRNWREVRDDV